MEGQIVGLATNPCIEYEFWCRYPRNTRNCNNLPVWQFILDVHCVRTRRKILILVDEAVLLLEIVQDLHLCSGSE